MSTFEETHRIEIPQDQADPIRDALEFYALNGYRRLEPSNPDALSHIARARLERGKPGAGWWASAMFELHTLVECELDGNALVLHYAVDIKGQHLDSVERSYWQRETRRIEQVLHGEAELVDLRPAEKHRAASARKRLRSTGYTAAFVVFLILSAIFLLMEFF